ncbi:DUF6931 family protein [Aureimonas pseudogalii]|uniref:Uncharacterized protein n=1 Tax=Aureimonas pseudogalii TaxID=1744844 RepID=A0A7W6H8M6_9HYPH|nr:hypothetical protein [Aureimonas pseudogalii]MBB4000433.1 hypothetical protein [Aureimonas pseudogalii]
MAVPIAPIQKIGAATAVEVCGRVALSVDAQAYLTPSLSPQGFLTLLNGSGLLTDAVRFLAFALPVREGVWWACMAGSAVPGATSIDPDPAYRAAQDWVYETTDERRFLCLQAAESVQSATPGAYAALAAFWSGGSMAPLGLPEVLPDPVLAPTGIAASILLAVAAGNPERAASFFQDVIDRGIDIGNGGDGRQPVVSQFPSSRAFN